MRTAGSDAASPPGRAHVPAAQRGPRAPAQSVRGAGRGAAGSPRRPCEELAATPRCPSAGLADRGDVTAPAKSASTCFPSPDLHMPGNAPPGSDHPQVPGCPLSLWVPGARQRRAFCPPADLRPQITRTLPGSAPRCSPGCPDVRLPQHPGLCLVPSWPRALPVSLYHMLRDS